MKPKRIQRKRTKGWKMPENTVYVGRPTIWGNPFRDLGDMVYVDASHRRKMLNPWVYFNAPRNKGAADLFRMMLMNLNSLEVEPAIRERFKKIREMISDLHGKDLACWCKEGEPCHADILLEIAND